MAKWLIREATHASQGTGEALVDSNTAAPISGDGYGEGGSGGGGSNGDAEGADTSKRIPPGNALAISQVGDASRAAIGGRAVMRVDEAKATRLRILTEVVTWQAASQGRAAQMDDMIRVIETGRKQIERWSNFAGEMLHDIDSDENGLITREEFRTYARDNPFVITAVLGCTSAGIEN
mmetsp:Transcript_35217/g.60793  ORF Transcript_35217/g.60793 Transcript_35217/m.60793 type:complete len:178 (-) Transcript_35217:15-548(-)